MTFAELKAKVRFQLWYGQEQENLIAIHDAYFVEALFILQKAVACYRRNHKRVLPHCAGYFNCGLTVVPKPEGVIRGIYTIDRINPDTGLEDPIAEPNWCSKVHYSQVEFCRISQYVKLCERCGSSLPAADAILNAFFGVYRPKRFYPKPTDEGMEGLPALPEGFHYPQASTDAAGRSASGVWAIEGGMIYVAPWIQSTETLVIESNAIKTEWGEFDPVESTPEFIQAVRFHVGMQHELAHGEPQKAADFRNEFFGSGTIPGALPLLIHECEEQNRIRSCAEGGQSGSSARGMGVSVAAFYNDTRYEHTAHCPAGKTGGPFTVVKEIGSVPSAFSIADANARAAQQAQDEANARLSACVTTEVVYWNTAQVGSASCPGASADGLTPAANGPSVNFTEPANLHSSPDSVEAANALAKAAADATAQSMLTCTFHNRAQTRTAVCPTGTVGDEQEATIPAGQPEYDSTISQIDADSKAGIAAQNAAEAMLDCGSDTFLVSNSARSASATGICQRCSQTRFVGGGETICVRQPITAMGAVSAGEFSGVATSATAGTVTGQLNAQAQAEAQRRAQAALQQLCRGMGGTLV